MRKAKVWAVTTLSILMIVGMAPMAHGYNVEISKELEEAENKASKEEGSKAQEKAEEETRVRQNQEAEAAQGEQKAQEERAAREVGERETAEKDAAEKEKAATVKVAKTACRVPSLRGRHLEKVGTILRQHHCSLGKVTHSHKYGRRHSELAVIDQQYGPATQLPSGSSVNVTVGVVSTSKHK